MQKRRGPEGSGLPARSMPRRVTRLAWPKEETTMKTNHLVASAVITGMLLVTGPTHAQGLGGGARAGFGGAFGASMGGVHGAATAGAASSFNGGIGRQPVGSGRVDQKVDTSARGATQASAHAADKATVATHQDVREGASAASEGGKVAANTAANAGATAGAAVQRETQAREVGANNALNGTVSGNGVSGSSVSGASVSGPASRTVAAGSADEVSSASRSTANTDGGATQTRSSSTPAAGGNSAPQRSQTSSDAGVSTSAGVSVSASSAR